MQASFPLRRRGPLFYGKRKKNIRFSWRGRETVSWLKRHAQPSEFPPGFTSWRRGCCQGRTHKILKTHKVSGPCWNCPPGGALKTHEILKTHKVSGPCWNCPPGGALKTHGILKTHKGSGPCWNCPPGGALKTHEILKTHKVGKSPAGRDGQEKQVGKLPSVRPETL